MTLEEKLFSALSSVCQRVFPDGAPQGTEMPYVVYQQYGGTALRYVEGPVGSVRNSFVQINVWSMDRAESNRISLLIEDALISSQEIQCEPISALSATFDEDTKIRGSMQDFSIWSNRN